MVLLAAACLAGPSASAEGLRPAGYFVQGGVAQGRVWSATAGLVWPWQGRLFGHQFSGITEAFVSHWDAPGAGGRSGFTQVGVAPLVRWNFGGGRSPWFAEAGIGLSAMDRHFVTPDKQFSTSFNFVDIVGAGRRFGAGGKQELSLRLQHVSNGGYRKPNPGENFLQLRYASAF
jgi:lipid A 3-O-deacylase